MPEVKGQLALFDMLPACQRFGGCLAEIGAELDDPSPDLWHCYCGRTAAELKAAQL